MANAAKRMKEKKAKQLEEIMKAKGVVEVVEDVVVAGVVTDVTVDYELSDEYTEDELNDMLKSDLIEITESSNLDTNGTKADLIERILMAQRQI